MGLTSNQKVLLSLPIIGFDVNVSAFQGMDILIKSSEVLSFQLSMMSLCIEDFSVFEWFIGKSIFVCLI